MSEKSKRSGRWDFMFAVGLSVLLVLAILYVAFVLLFGLSDVDRAVRLGSWGDFVGGVLNPILTFFTFVGLLATIVLQRSELALTRDEMARSADALEAQGLALGKQSFERTFFEMLNLHNSIVNSIDLASEAGSIVRGRDCFRVFYTRFTKIYREAREKGRGSYKIEQTLDFSWSIFWKENQLELGHYFRFLYNFVKFVDLSAHSEPHHMKLVRSQLSDQELLLLFYNCTQPVGQKFRALAEKHELFDNMPTVRLLDAKHADYLNKSAFGQNNMLTGPQVRRQTTTAKNII